MQSMNEFPAVVWNHRFALLGAYFLLVGLEFAWTAWKQGRGTAPTLLAVNVGMWMVELGLRAGTFAFRLGVFTAAASLIPWRAPTSVPVGLALLFVVDFTYYWKHRLLHRTRLGWALHAPHHSSDDFNLLAAIRLGWVQRVLDDFFFVPLLVLGPAPLLLMLIVDLDESLQFWCHTEAIGTLGVLDRYFNTPANHRLHHARARRTADGNYGAVFMLWDRMFGTYRGGPRPEAYGWEGRQAGLNPFRIQFASLLAPWGLSRPGPRRE